MPHSRRGTFPNRYRFRGIVSGASRVFIGVSNYDASLDSTTFNPSEQDSVRWWIPLVAATGGLLVLVLGAAAMVSGLVNSTISSIG